VDGRHALAATAGAATRRHGDARRFSKLKQRSERTIPLHDTTIPLECYLATLHLSLARLG
jgi:hypothetical protein